MLLGLLFVWLNRGSYISLSHNDKINITPTQIRSIENIGEWEFFAISDEEIVDTIRHGFFGDDQLVRIYYGTLRLGINLHDTKSGWLKANHDTIIAQLPPIVLLDNNFIDEGKSKSFFEKGKWSQEAREKLYNKAYRIMLKRCLTTENIRNAEQNAIIQFENMLHTLGFKYTQIKFEERNPK